MLFKKKKKEKKTKMHSGLIPPPGCARVRLPPPPPRISSTVAGQGRVTAALDAQDHGMVTCAFPKSISSPGMIPSPAPSPPSLRQRTAILRVEGRRDIHVEGYGSSGEGGRPSMGCTGDAPERGWRRSRRAPSRGHGSDMQPPPL